ncbi:hypothetical protein ACFRMQ_11460 [Kitasatospora sp. NPDC056783]|uniref:hypothetical protein n=1 Tax=Kitasatospora sp. NPDC056783 TaxID=3345943 RepID=UPI00367682C0
MSREIETHLPASLRKYAVMDLECETDGQFDLMNACKALDMGRSNNSTTVPLTNDALGALLDICREWLSHENYGKSQAAKTVLKRHELDHVPSDPRERRHEVKMPKSLGSYVSSQVTQGFLKDRPELRAELDACMMGDSSLSGRVTYTTLGWLLEIAKTHSLHGTGANQRAGKKFVELYTEAYAQTIRLVNVYLGTDDEEPEGPEVAWDFLTELAQGQVILFAGTDRETPTDPVLVTVSLPSVSKVALLAVDDGRELHRASPWSEAWWVRADEADQVPAEVEVIEDQDQDQDQDAGVDFPAAVEDEHQEPEEDQAEPPKSSRGPVPENFRWMAEEAITETARAWWRGKVEEWGK